MNETCRSPHKNFMRVIPVLLWMAVVSATQAQSIQQTKPVGKPMRAGSAPSATAKVVAVPAGLDFGIVAPHTILEGDFKLINTSATPLTVLGAQPTCQCTTIDITGKVIPAQSGGSPGILEVPVTMKVSATGIKTAQVKVVVAGEPAPITLDLRAEVAYAVRVSILDAAGNTQPYVDAAVDASRLQGVAQVISRDGKPFRVLSVQGEAPVFVGWNPTLDPPQSNYQIQFSLTGEPCEAVPKYLLVETDRAEARMIDARVRHACTKISPALEIAEFRCNAGVIPAGGSGTVELEIKKMGSNRIASARAVDSRFTAQLVGQRSDGSSLMVTLRLTPGKDFSGVFLTPVHLVAADSQGRPYMTQRPEAGAPGQPPNIIQLPAEVDVLVYGKVE